MKTDKELLELAAKSIGLAQPWSERAQAYRWAEGSDWIEWNPLTNNGDAFTTMVKLGLLVSVQHGPDRMKALIEVVVPHPLADISLPFDGDGVDATRRAIVLAAAAMGENTMTTIKEKLSRGINPPNMLQSMAGGYRREALAEIERLEKGIDELRAENARLALIVVNHEIADYKGEVAELKARLEKIEKKYPKSFAEAHPANPNATCKCEHW